MSDQPIIHQFTTEAAKEKLPTVPRIDSSHAASEDLAEAERQAAFDSAFEWQGKALHGFSSSRKNLFVQLRLAMGAPALDACLEDVDAFSTDAARLLWLCSHRPEDWSILRSSPAALQCAIDTWSDTIIPPALSLAASTLALRIWNAAHHTQHEAAPVRKAHGDDMGN